LTDQHDVFFPTRLLSIDTIGLAKNVSTTTTAESTEELETGSIGAKKKDVKDASFWEG
jgi:hypothetical protein